MADLQQQNTALGVIVAFPVLGGIAIILRLWSRFISRSKLGSGKYKYSARPTDLHDLINGRTMY